MARAARQPRRLSRHAPRGGGGRRGGGEGGAPLPIVPRGRAREAARGGSPVALVTALARPRLRRPEGRRKGAHAPPGPPPPLAGKLLGGPRGLRHSALRGPHLSQRAGVGFPAAGRYRVRRLPVASPAELGGRRVEQHLLRRAAPAPGKGGGGGSGPGELA